MANAIRLVGVTRAFKDDIVIRDVSFTVSENTVVALIGGNGSGKTTLLELTAGVLRPTLGSVKMQLSGTDLRDVYQNRHEAKKYFGFGLQSPSFYPSMTVGENVEYFASLHGMEDTSTETYRNELLRRLELNDRFETTASRLSGGMKKRLDIACATVHQPRYIFLDEPASDLDPELRSTVWNVIDWFTDNGATVLFSTHYLRELQTFTDRVAVLREGRLETIESPGNLKSRIDADVTVELTIRGNKDEVLSSLRELFHVKSEQPLLVEAEDTASVMRALRDNNWLDDVTDVSTRRKGLESLIYE